MAPQGVQQSYDSYQLVTQILDYLTAPFLICVMSDTKMSGTFEIVKLLQFNFIMRKR